LKTKLKIRYLILLSLVVAVFSCKKLDEFPPEPEIKYQGFERLFNSNDSIYDRGVLALTFTDGDGDLGLNKEDTLPPFHFDGDYYFNLVITYFEIENGVAEEIPLVFYNPVTEEFDTLTQSARFPSLTPDAVNKSISGEIYDTVFIFNPNSDNDSIMFEAFIYDRSLNKSNTIRTDTIVRR
jgi:hypothetical protein